MSRSRARGLSWTLQIVVAVILLQTLFFKFTAADESVYIFTQVGAEPWGRVGSGVVELIASVLLLTPATIVSGAVLSLAIATGAILSHLAVLGIEVMGDGGLLFALAIVVWVASLTIVAMRRDELPLPGVSRTRVRQAR